MKPFIQLFLVTAGSAIVLLAQSSGMPPADLLKPLKDSWPTYNGDYTGRRYSRLDQITPANVNRLRAQWVFHAPNSDSLEVTRLVFDQ